MNTFPPRVWLDSNDIEDAEPGSYHWTNKAPDDTKFDVPYMSVKEHIEIIKELESSLKVSEEKASLYESKSMQVIRFGAKNVELERKLKIATEALSKYASCYDSDECRFEEDCGVCARKALAEIKGKTE